ncbi:MAG: hypothetical protein ABI600_02125 [Luteolibacter sp.]
MAIRSVALVDRTSGKLDKKEVRNVAAAIQRQIVEHISPTWGHTGSVIALEQGDTIPPTYFPVFLNTAQDSSGLDGIHYFTDRGEVYSNVNVNAPVRHWSLVASHETVEIVTDPTTDWKIPAPSIREGQGTVEYLLEICDPCQHELCGYYIDNVLVSDFYIPAYFNPTSSGPLSMSRKIQKPLQIMPGGYLVWRHLGDWYIGTADGSGQVKTKPYLGMNQIGKVPGDSIREKIDYFTNRLAGVGPNIELKGDFKCQLEEQRKRAERDAEQAMRFGKQRWKAYESHRKQISKGIRDYEKLKKEKKTNTELR